MPHNPQDSGGPGLTFRFSPLHDPQADSHWTGVQMAAFHPSQEEPVAVMKAAYVSRAVGGAINRERLLLAHIRGWDTYPQPGPDFSNPSSWDEWKRHPLGAARYVAREVMGQGLADLDLEGKSRQELVDYVEAHRPHLNAHTQNAIERMFDFAVHKANVEPMDLKGRWRAQEIVERLHEAMARHLDEQCAVTLNCSPTASSDTRRHWDTMRKKGMAQMDPDGRMFFVQGVSESTLAGRQVRPDPLPMPPRVRGPGPA